jgi:hypothetical protein
VAMATTLEVRQALVDRDYVPIPLEGKIPVQTEWQKTENVSVEMLKMWAKTWPRANNTGILTKFTPALDIDILNEPAAIATEDLVRERFEERGYILPRVGKPPKRAIPFRTVDPFVKIVVNLIAANGVTGEKIEFLASGQQFVADGIHPATGAPYAWPLGNLVDIAHDDLPDINAVEAQQLVDDIVDLLCRDFGYMRAAGRPTRKSNGAQPIAAAKDWQALVDNILAGNELHANTRDLAAKMVRSGMDGGAIVNFLRGLMNSSAAPRDDRWQRRYDNLPRQVESMRRKLENEQTAATAAAASPPPEAAPAVGGAGFGTPPPPPPPAPAIGPAPAAAPGPIPSSPIEATLQTFERWLILPNRMPVYAMLGTVAANLLPGEPTWLGLIAPPSSAKTELINALTGLPFVVTASTLTPAGLLSGTPRRQRAAGAKGGLLRQVSDPGLLCLKDFTSILTMRPDAKAEILGVLREIYDGHYVRRLGTDGGRELEWRGKLGLIFGCTNVIDTHYSIENALGNRFLLARSEPNRAQFRWALKHTGASFAAMRRELADSVSALFASPLPDPQPLDPDGDEFKRSTAWSISSFSCAEPWSAIATSGTFSRFTAPKAPLASGLRWSGSWLDWIRSDSIARPRSMSSRTSRWIASHRSGVRPTSIYASLFLALRHRIHCHGGPPKRLPTRCDCRPRPSVERWRIYSVTVSANASMAVRASLPNGAESYSCEIHFGSRETKTKPLNGYTLFAQAGYLSRKIHYRWREHVLRRVFYYLLSKEEGICGKGCGISVKITVAAVGYTYHQSKHGHFSGSINNDSEPGPWFDAG